MASKLSHAALREQVAAKGNGRSEAIWTAAWTFTLAYLGLFCYGCPDRVVGRDDAGASPEGPESATSAPDAGNRDHSVTSPSTADPDTSSSAPPSPPCDSTGPARRCTAITVTRANVTRSFILM